MPVTVQPQTNAPRGGNLDDLPHVAKAVAGPLAPAALHTDRVMRHEHSKPGIQLFKQPSKAVELSWIDAARCVPWPSVSGGRVHRDQPYRADALRKRVGGAIEPLSLLPGSKITLE